MNEPDAFARHDAAYVLGALSPRERAAYEAHLAECAECARSVRELAGLPGLLGQAGATVPGLTEWATSADGEHTDRDAVLAGRAEPAVRRPGETPEGMLPALLRRVAAERRRSAWRRRLLPAALGLALAACAALLAVLVLPGGDGGGGDGSGDGGGGQRPAAIAMTPLVDYPVEANVALADTDWGTRVDMDCRYGWERSNEYVLVAITPDGRERELSRWVAVPDVTVSMSLGTALRRDDIGTLEVRSTSGYAVLRVDLTERR
ncbi:anti-sigma factor family protein [Streptomyces sp. 4N509B]|uniref:anti-sigma factor family protein n=1 Tax=Streptomyces sp. 4N509B TaxID=3457413 RepID=UPI003FD04BA5